MIPVKSLLLAAFASLTAFGFWKFFQVACKVFTSPLRHLRGPKATSWILGNQLDVLYSEDSVLHEDWIKRYGSILTFKGWFCTNKLYTMDMRAINYILTHSNDYHKPSFARYNLLQILGEGILTVEGARHRQQRRILNPAFGPAQIRVLTDVFFAKAIKLRDVLSSEVARDPAGATTGTRLEILAWLSRTILDVIGLAGFNYEFDALNANEKPNELSEALATMVASDMGLSFFSALQAQFPLLRIIPSHKARRAQAARRTLTCIGKKLLSDAEAVARGNTTGKDEIKRNNLQGRDLLSLLVKANMATDIPESQRLSDEDVLAQVPTFLVAGRGTTSLATTWALYAMAIAPNIQTKLREELFSVDTDTPTMDELMALPYLDAVVRETLRVHPPVPRTERIAMKDDVIPVEKPYTDKNGVLHDSIKINRGDTIFIPILAIHLSQELWGPDAHEFKPERWENVPGGVSRIPGLWSHLLSFLGGPRACIGYRFALVEIKVLLFTLVRAFEFELAVPASEVGKKTLFLQRPMLRSDPKGGPQLPLLLRPYQRT